ncbi:hypothetical protein [Tomitella cavernea]|uniref:Uncharacterized protein n=1 Tax=Tomitella cavernea TaxID=1387982 RepID=A0ABP9CS55_9ACTN|nr:hypothetical protein [Tomitella cavernea]
MTALRRVPAEAWTVVVIVAVVIAVFLVGRANPIPPPTVTTDALGPAGGETVAEYTARAAASLQARGPSDAESGPPDALHWALVSFEQGVSADAAARSAAPMRISEVLSHVPVDGAQTPVTPVQVPATDDPAVMVARAQSRAADVVAQRTGLATAPGEAAGSGDTAGSGHAAGSRETVAAAVVDGLRGGCACVMALVVHGTLGDLRAVAGRPGVLAVEALPADAVFGSFAVRPPVQYLR